MKSSFQIIAFTGLLACMAESSGLSQGGVPGATGQQRQPVANPNAPQTPQGFQTGPQGMGPANTPAISPQGVNPAITPQSISPTITPQSISPAITPQGVSPAITPQGTGQTITPGRTALPQGSVIFPPTQPQGTIVLPDGSVTTVVPQTGTPNLNSGAMPQLPSGVGGAQGTGVAPQPSGVGGVNTLPGSMGTGNTLPGSTLPSRSTLPNSTLPNSTLPNSRLPNSTVPQQQQQR